MTRMKDIIKNYKPSKKLCLLYFFIPILLSILFIEIKNQGDIWFLLNHGKYIFNNGFPKIEPFTIHKDLSFVMQQWLSSIIFYSSYSISSRYGLYLVCFLVNILIMIFTYKLSMLLSKNNYRISTFFTIFTDFLLLLFRFITPRPQIFTYLLLIITMYIMEIYLKNKKSKVIYFLPLISLLQINFHASMYFMIYIFMLPYIIYLIINKKYKEFIKLMSIILIMLLVAFINPYGLRNILYVFYSYGNNLINQIVIEMQPLSLFSIEGILFYSILFITIIFFCFYKKRKFNLKSFLLLVITIFLAITNKRNIALFVITIPLIISFLENRSLVSEKIKFNKDFIKILAMYLIILIPLFLIVPIAPYSSLEKGVDKLLTSNKKEDIVLYTNFDNGSYAEYRGIKCYIDARAEVFLKSMNKKEDIFKEYYLLYKGKLDYRKFIDKYSFTHLIVNSQEAFFDQIIKDKDYKVIYYGKCQKNIKCEENEDYIILEKLN